MKGNNIKNKNAGFEHLPERVNVTAEAGGGGLRYSPT
jgi:hypothetical protein